MSLVALQPSGNGASRAHYVDTIESPVPQVTLARFLSPSQMQRVREIYGEQRVPTWGVTPGQNDINVGKWKRLDVGSVTLFAADKRIFASGVVTMKFRDAELARHLWGNQGDGQTWEYMYFLDEVYGHNIKYAELNAVAGYQPHYVIQGFNVLSPEKSAAILETFELQSSMHIGDEELDEDQATSFAKGQLDIEGTVKLRGEQRTLRKEVFGTRRTHKCAICGEEYPTDLLVAAHIKKRSRCSDDEKRALSDIAAPMCRMGCDELFERGFIAIDSESILVSPHLERTQGLKQYLNRLEKSRPTPRPGQVPYYAWHRDNIFKA